MLEESKETHMAKEQKRKDPPFEVLTVRFPPDLLKKLKAEAKRKGLVTSSLIRSILVVKIREIEENRA